MNCSSNKIKEIGFSTASSTMHKETLSKTSILLSSIYNIIIDHSLFMIKSMNALLYNFFRYMLIIGILQSNFPQREASLENLWDFCYFWKVLNQWDEGHSHRFDFHQDKESLEKVTEYSVLNHHRDLHVLHPTIDEDVQYCSKAKWWQRDCAILVLYACQQLLINTKVILDHHPKALWPGKHLWMYCKEYHLRCTRSDMRWQLENKSISYWNCDLRKITVAIGCQGANHLHLLEIAKHNTMWSMHNKGDWCTINHHLQDIKQHHNFHLQLHYLLWSHLRDYTFNGLNQIFFLFILSDHFQTSNREEILYENSLISCPSPFHQHVFASWQTLFY